MKIVRDGKEIELTPEEIVMAYREKATSDDVKVGDLVIGCHIDQNYGMLGTVSEVRNDGWIINQSGVKLGHTKPNSGQVPRRIDDPNIIALIRDLMPEIFMPAEMDEN